MAYIKKIVKNSFPGKKKSYEERAKIRTRMAREGVDCQGLQITKYLGNVLEIQ